MIAFTIDELTPCLIIGQTKSYSKHQDIVDRFLESTNIYDPGESIPFDLHGYLEYVSENHIKDPDSVPDDVMAQFYAIEKAFEAS